MSNPVTIEQTPFDRLRSRTKGDTVIWTAVVLLAVVSLLVVYSSTGLLAYKMYKGNTEIYLFKQFAFIVVGVLIIQCIPGWRLSYF
jgi:cell division protein FtsW